MFKKLVSKMLVAGMLLGCLASCSDNSGKIMQMGDASIEGIDISVDGDGFVADSNYINESLFRYLYLYFKENMLSSFKQYESAGYNVTGDENIRVDDTKEFWNCIYSKDEDGKDITFGQYLYDSTVELFDDILALEASAEKYGYKLPESYDKDFNEAVAQQIVATGAEYLNGTSEITDADGNLYDWVKNRWAMDLMSEGISTEAWERVFFLYPNVIIKDITTQFEEKGIIKAEADEVLKEKGEKELKEKLDAFMKNNMKVKYIAYVLKAEESENEASKEPKSVESGESSEVSSVYSSEDVSSEDMSDDVSSEDASSEDISDDIDENLSPKEYNEQLRQKCKDIYNGILDGSLDIDDEVKKCDIAESAADYPDGIAATFDAFEQTFGESVKDLKVGDVKMYEHSGAIHIIQVQELTEADSNISTELTEDDLEALRAQSVSEDFERLLEQYKAVIVYDNDLLEKYKAPWNIN